MNAAKIAAAAAVAAVVVTILGGMVMLIYKVGRHAQRLDSAEADITKLTENQEEHSRAIGALEQFRLLLQEVRDDVKALMLGRGGRAGVLQRLGLGVLLRRVRDVGRSFGPNQMSVRRDRRFGDGDCQ